jgi:hypothetical protein
MVMGQKHGPYVALAVFCENVIEDKSGVLSVIRVIDTFTLLAQGPNVPEQLPQGQIQVKCVVALKSGDAKGRHRLSIVPHLPSGQQGHDLATVPVVFEGENRGNNIIIDLNYSVEHEGVHWFHVVLNDDQILTKMPLNVIYQPMRTAFG